MNKGFQIEIQEGLTDDEAHVALKEANWFIKEVTGHGMSWKHMTEGGYRSFYKRGTLGVRIRNKDDSGDSGLYFRRASRTKRIFQVVRGADLNVKSGQAMNYDEAEPHNGKLGSACRCPNHEGSLKVDTKYGDIKTDVYCTIGVISG